MTFESDTRRPVVTTSTTTTERSNEFTAKVFFTLGVVLLLGWIAIPVLRPSLILPGSGLVFMLTGLFLLIRDQPTVITVTTVKIVSEVDIPNQPNEVEQPCVS